MGFFKALLRRLPRSILNFRHFWFAWCGDVKYGHPSERIFVIGVTGTSGKSSVIYFLKQILESVGKKVGALSTVEFCVAGTCRLNDKKMTMLGKMEIQRYLRQMIEDRCEVAIIETTSEGARQYRHRFINYDVIALTNLYPEHIESHGSFENYKNAKRRIFADIAGTKRKVLDGQTVPKIAVVNSEVKECRDFLGYSFDKKFTFSKSEAENVQVTKDGIVFRAFGREWRAPIYGEYNVVNLLCAMKLARLAGVSDNQIAAALRSLLSVPGRIEFIPEARPKGFEVIVDYAFETVAMDELYKVVQLFAPKKIIHVFGSTGGGRDVERRFSVGKMVGTRADICIVTDEDPYDDDPASIMSDVAAAVRGAGKVDGTTLFTIPDRRNAIRKANELAQAGDMVLLTGKGSEQAMAVRGTLVPWDDRVEVRQAMHSC